MRPCFLFVFITLGLILPAPAHAKVQDPVFDLPAIIAAPLNAKTLKGPYEKDGVMVEEVVFHSEMDGAKSVDIFAILAYPKGAKGLPAFVWNQGGLAQASDYFPILGAKRGYAALCIDFPINGYRSTGGYPINNTIATADDPKQAPIYHGAVALLRAVSYLESRSEVDRNRIGMCGSSWGGYYTTLMVGVDPRLKVGAAMFGCGFLDGGNAWWGPQGGANFPKPEYVKQWMATFDAGPRLKKTKTPIGWFTGTDDMFYWMPAVMKSYAAAGGPKHLTLFPNWAHALPEEGDEAVFAYLDVYLQGKPPLIDISPLKIVRHKGEVFATWKYSTTHEAKTADLILSYGDDGNWVSRHWTTLGASYENGVGKGLDCSAVLPAAPMVYYISGSVTDAASLRSSTPLVRVDVAALGLLDPKVKLDDNGCDMWGGFEPEQIIWSVRHSFMNPVVSTDARTGKQSAKFIAGTHRLYPFYSTAGVPYRLSLWIKADKPTEVKIAGVPAAAAPEQKFAVGTGWSELTLDFKPHEITGSPFEAVLTVPDGATVLVDDVSFRPR